EDPSADDSGHFCYVRDLDSGAVWSTTRQPVQAAPEHYEAVFSEGRAEFRRSDHGIELHTEIVVSPEDDIELRRIRIANKSGRVRRIELTGYAEVVLAPAALDAAHPVFSRMFVQTEILPERGAILCTRRPQTPDERPPVLLNLMAVHGAVADAYDAPSFETSRAAFIGRGRRNALPAALADSGPLGAHAGTVLDPAVAIRRVLTLAPEQAITVDVVLGVAATRDAAIQLVDKYQAQEAGNPLADRVFELAWTHGQAVLRQLNASEPDAQLYGCLAGAVLYPQAALRADPALIARNGRGQSGLWPYAVSGDWPIVLLQLRDAANIELARQLDIGGVA
ncbi:MAG: cyclic beta 1-2 glucan synthetase, partial [Variovorax sp.]